MATTKKSTTTKKKTTTRKRPAAKKATHSKKAAQSARSFRVAKPDTPFMTFAVTRQTVYWLVLGIIFIVFTLWINKVQSDVQAIYDSIDAVQSEINAVEMTDVKKKEQ